MEMVEIISNVGFPIACCIYLIYNQTKIQEAHHEEMKLMSKSIDNNTKAIQNLERSIEKWQTK